jgi:hypothetical protein
MPSSGLAVSSKGRRAVADSPNKQENPEQYKSGFISVPGFRGLSQRICLQPRAQFFNLGGCARGRCHSATQYLPVQFVLRYGSDFRRADVHRAC